MSRLLSSCWLIVAAGFLLWTIALSVQRTVPVPFHDSYAFVIGFADWLEQDPLRSLLAFQAGHRIVLSRLIVLPLISLGIWTQTMHAILNGLLTAASIGLFTILVLRTCRHPGLRVLLIGAGAILLTHWTLWSHYHLTLGMPMVQLLLLGGITALSGRNLKRRHLVVAGICCAGATFSFTNGVLCWPALVPLLWRRCKRRRIVSFVWLMIGASLGVLYYWGIPIHADPQHVLLHPASLWDAPRFFLAVLGLPLFRGVLGLQIWLGLLVFVCTLLLLHRTRTTDAALPWICWITFAILGAAMLAVGRSSYGLEQAFASRYVVITSGVVLGSLMLSAQTMPRAVWPLTATLLFIVPLTLSLSLYQDTLQRLEPWRKGHACLSFPETAMPSCLRFLKPQDEMLLALRPLMIERNIFQPLQIDATARFFPAPHAEGYVLPRVAPREGTGAIVVAMSGQAATPHCDPANLVVFTVGDTHRVIAATPVFFRFRTWQPTCPRAGWYDSKFRLPEGTDITTLRAWAGSRDNQHFWQLRPKETLPL